MKVSSARHFLEVTLKTSVRIPHFRLVVNLSSESASFNSQTETTLIFARDLSREGGAIKEKVEGFKAAELTFFRGVRKAVRVKPVLDQEGWMKAPAFYLERAENESEEKTILSLVQREGDIWKGRDLEVAKKHEVVGVRMSDLNLDGEADYLVTAVNKEQDRITFDYFFKKRARQVLKKPIPLPSLSTIDFPLSINQFAELLLLTRKVGDKLIKLPAFYEAYTMPDADNSFDILDRIPEDFRAYHLYFLKPRAGEKELELRVVDSLEQLERIREDIDAPNWLPLNLEKPFPQSQVERRQGTVSGLIALGEEFEREYFSYKILPPGLEMNRVFFDDRFVSGNSVRALMSLNSDSLGVATDDVEFLAQLKRDQVRSYVWSPESLQGQALLLETKKWSDPVFNMIASFKNEKRTRFVETRYFIQSFDQKNAPQKLRINRESSFPGVQFSETLEPVAVVGEGDESSGYFY
jgi:cell wall-associated protease